MLPVVFFNVEIDGAILFIGVARLEYFLYHGDLLDDVARSVRLDAGMQHVHHPHRFMVSVCIILHHLHRLKLFQAGLFADLVITRVGIAFQMADIRNVPHIPDFIADVLQITEYQVEGDGRPRMPQVRITVNRRSANVHADMRRAERLEKLFLPGEGVVNVKLMLHIKLDLKAKVMNI